MNIYSKLRKSFLLLCILAGATAVSAQMNIIHPMEIWPDNLGNHIQAHGGGFTKIGSMYYWYGEERRQGLDPDCRYVSCYSSTDLMNWKFRGNVLKMAAPDTLPSNYTLERPKVYYNKKTKKYVMYFHIDDPNRYTSAGVGYTLVQGNIGYILAQVGVAISEKPTGPFRFIRSFRPLGYESRDIGQFIDDDGTAYLIFEDRPHGFRIAKLSDDYLDIEKEVCLIPEHLESGAIVHYDGLYYVMGSNLSGWAANPNKYATAKSLEGPWSEFKDIAPPATNTYGSQSTYLLKVTGTKGTVVIYMGDVWKPDTQWDSRYLWMPLEIGDGKLWLPEPKPWTINVKTGECTIH